MCFLKFDSTAFLRDYIPIVSEHLLHEFATSPLETNSDLVIRHSIYFLSFPPPRTPRSNNASRSLNEKKKSALTKAPRTERFELNSRGAVSLQLRPFKYSNFSSADFYSGHVAKPDPQSSQSTREGASRIYPRAVNTQTLTQKNAHFHCKTS